MSHEPEIRSLDAKACELRVEANDAGRRVIRGTALRYGSYSSPLKDTRGRMFVEQFRAGAFSRSIATGARVRAMVNHDRNLILGNTAANTLTVSDDPDALRFEIDPPNTSIGEHYRVSVERGDMTGVSFGFNKLEDRWSGAGEATQREVLEADLFDISLTDFPAYTDTNAATRSLDGYASTLSRKSQARIRADIRLRLAESE